MSGREPGTLYNLRQTFKLVNVPSKVTNNYSACESLMLSSSKAYLCEAFMTWSEMPNLDSIPLWFKEVQAEEDPSLKWQTLQLHLGKFVDEFVTRFTVISPGNMLENLLHNNNNNYYCYYSVH